MSITLRSDMSVTLWRQGGCDLDIAESAWASAGDDDETERDRSDIGVSRLINSLMKQRHGVPFEEGYLSFVIECPIFVAREFMRHRIPWSYSEISGRYVELLPQFWQPADDRAYMVPEKHNPMRPSFEAPDNWTKIWTPDSLRIGYEATWDVYQMMLGNKVAKEVARAVLPVGIYTRFRARTNPRGLMNFISLRWGHENNAYPTYPMAEIQDVAIQMAAAFERHWPITWAAFDKHGRVAP